MSDYPPVPGRRPLTPRRVALAEKRMRKLRQRLRPRNRPRFKGPSFNRMLPNLLTMLGLCAGLTGMRFALDGRFGAAVASIAVAAAIDGMDGRLARLLKTSSRFGAEFDSLTDFLCFGVAPPFILYLWSLQAARGYGFMPCVLFTVCMALRLARFNASLEAPSLEALGGEAAHPAYTYNFFVGVPAPAGAGLVLFPLFVGLEARALHWASVLAVVQYPLFDAVLLTATALLLVSTLPVWSFKNFKVPAEYVLPLLLGTVLFALLLVADPWAGLATGCVIYAAMLPFSVRSFRRLKRTAESAPDEIDTPDLDAPDLDAAGPTLAR